MQYTPITDSHKEFAREAAALARKHDIHSLNMNFQHAPGKVPAHVVYMNWQRGSDEAENIIQLSCSFNEYVREAIREVEQ